MERKEKRKRSLSLSIIVQILLLIIVNLLLVQFDIVKYDVKDRLACLNRVVRLRLSYL